MQINLNITYPLCKSGADNWLPQFPNPADFRFDYYKLLKNAPNGLTKLPDDVRKNVAIIGAGAAGMTAARELLRCGFNVTVFEASERIGGRLFTVPNPVNESYTGMELGAMRMPFFPTPGSENCLLEYYLLYEAAWLGHRALYAQFPNPGSAQGDTGIYLNRGLGPENDFPNPGLILWPKSPNSEKTSYPKNHTLRHLSEKVEEFCNRFTDYIQKYYVSNTDEWPVLWEQIVKHYDPMTFDDLVMAPLVVTPEDGNFGGFGMNREEAELLYTIGTGDGSWGAFYSIGSLWFIRCTMFGFGGSQLQTITGLSNPGSLPHFMEKTVDSLEQPLPKPTYTGIQSLAEYLYYVPAPGSEYSLHNSPKARLQTRTTVTDIEWTRNAPDMQPEIIVKYENSNDTLKGKELFDYVFVSSGQWASQMSFQFKGFSQEQLPQAKITAECTQHNISSCKLFFPLTECYWLKPGNKIPQVIITDTFIQDAYSLRWGVTEADPGVMLASYTWEDDSLKLLPFDQDKLVKLVTDQLSQITTQTLGNDQDVTDYIDKEKPVMIRWITQPSYDGCAKLYRQNNESANQLDLSYNQNHGKDSHLYFIGENYSVEGGWTEPALRSSIDGVMQLLKHIGATFTVENFEFDRDYPRWGANNQRPKASG